MKALIIILAAVMLAGCSTTQPVGEPYYDGPLVRDDGTAVEEPTW